MVWLLPSGVTMVNLRDFSMLGYSPLRSPMVSVRLLLFHWNWMVD